MVAGGIRLGRCVTGTNSCAETFCPIATTTLISCGLFDEAVGAYALAHADAILDRNRRIVRENLVTLLEWVESEPHLSVVPPEAGTTALVYYDYDIPLLRFLHRYGEVQRCLRHAGRLLRGAEELSRGLRLLRRYGQLSEQRRDRARTG